MAAAVTPERCWVARGEPRVAGGDVAVRDSSGGGLGRRGRWWTALGAKKGAGELPGGRADPETDQDERGR